MAYEYKKEKQKEASEKVEKLLQDLPSYCRTFLIGREGKMSPQTRLTYMQRIHTFFVYLYNDNSYFHKKSMKDISLDDLANLETEDIEAFAYYIRHGGASGGAECKESSVNNYLSALNMFWRYFVTHGRIPHNPVAGIERASKPKHKIIRLNTTEKDGFMSSVSSGVGLTDKQNQARIKTSVRDEAICLTLIRTGLRVSELVGLNLKDVNLEETCFQVMRKRSKEDTVFFDDEVKEAILAWLDARPLYCRDKTEQALFVVTQGKYMGKRLSVRSVQLLVKKYAEAGAPTAGSKITPHKLRATFATDMLRATGNVALVQEELNHESPTTTMLYADRRVLDLKRARNILMNEEEMSSSVPSDSEEKAFMGSKENESEFMDRDKAGALYKKDLM